jgi:hypothetical protein
MVSVRNPKIVAVVEEDSKLPLWLLANAKLAATHTCRLPTASAWDGFVALMSVCTAAEALVNRLLEPLVSAKEWDGAGAKSLERRPLLEKWAKLSSILETRPILSLGTDPLQSFKKVIDVRNALVHFKHGRNLRRFETEMPYRFGDALPSVEELARETPRRVLQEGSVQPALAPSLAPSYYAAFVHVLMPVLESCATTDLAGVAGRIRETLDKADEVTRKDTVSTR